MVENSWDTEADAELAEKIDLGFATATERRYMETKYGEAVSDESEGMAP